MPNVAKVLREEISRIGRKEAKAAFTPLQKRTIKLERAAAELKRRLAALEKEYKRLQGQLKVMQAAQPAPVADEPAPRTWISGKGVRSLRRKLGLSQTEFAKLVSVSDQAVYNWEKKPGMLKLWGKTKTAIFSVRGIGAREAKRRMEEIKAAESKSKAPLSKRTSARRRRKG